jgi:NAD dependent epimerase/dehydratase family enzyme
VPVPEVALRLLLGEGAYVPLSSQRVLPRRALDLGYKFRYPELKAALVATLAQ